MMRNPAWPAIFVVSLGLYPGAHAQPEPSYDLGEIVVTASRIPTTFFNTNRTIIVIGREEIEISPAHSIPELLEDALGVDVRQRGPLGVQSDVGIRGGTFEQTLILIDGIKVSDPQTGHHNLDLPLTVDDIERIEILKGPGSRLYGPNAFAGVINIITKKGVGKQAHLKATAGDFRFFEGYGSLSYPIGTSGHRLSFSKRKSGGYRANTDFDIFTLFYSSSLELGSTEVNFSSGYIDKDFGANNFYYENPNQWEHTKTAFLNAGAYLNQDWLTLSPALYWRYHKDDYSALEDRMYRNRHTTNSYGVELQTTLSSPLGLTAFGGEAGNEEIESTNLGNHSRGKGGFFLAHQLAPVKNLTADLGGFAYHYPDWGWEIWPGIDLGYQFRKRWRLYGSIGRSFRVPTYTELYYDGPGNQGNPDLKPEEAWTYEGGLRWSEKYLWGDLSIFRRNGSNLIDWVRSDAASPWEARNIARINTSGVEISLGFDPTLLSEHSPVPRMRLGYAYLDSDKEKHGLESKYVLTHFKHQFIFAIEHFLAFQLRQNWRLRYEKRMDAEKYFLVDTKIERRFKNIELFLEVTNLLDTDYTEVGDIPMPGRWVMAGLKVSFSREL